MDRHLTPAETAKRFGVSIKALRLYEQHGLLIPLRTEAGWRTYGPVQIARLHQILALKRLGLPLAQIAELLTGPDRLDSVLAIQEQKLDRESERLARALALVRAAKAKLASGQALSIDDLATLTKETVMTATKEETKKLFDQTFARHFTEEERGSIIEKRSALREEWLTLKPQLMAAMEAGDPTLVEARAVAERCRELSKQLLGPNNELRSRFQAFRDDVAQDPKISGVMQVTPEMNDFLKQALAAK